MTRRYTFNILLLILPTLMVSGCMGQSAPTKPIYYYTVDYEPQGAVTGESLPWILRVHRFSVSPPFNSQRMIYADKGLHRNGYGYHQWIASPGELLPYLLARDLKHSRSFQAVLTPDAALQATHNVLGWVEQFVEQDAANPRQAFVRLHITLISALETDPSRRVLLQKSYQAKAACMDKTPGALAQAMSDAVAAINQAVVQDLQKQLMPN